MSWNRFNVCKDTSGFNNVFSLSWNSWIVFPSKFVLQFKFLMSDEHTQDKSNVPSNKKPFNWWHPIKTKNLRMSRGANFHIHTPIRPGEETKPPRQNKTFMTAEVAVHFIKWANKNRLSLSSGHGLDGWLMTFEISAGASTGHYLSRCCVLGMHSLVCTKSILRTTPCDSFNFP